jgi:hypothetical protein
MGLTSLGSGAAPTGPIGRTQPGQLHWILAATLVGLARRGPLAIAAVGGELATAAAIELGCRLDLPTARAALRERGRPHAASPPAGGDADALSAGASKGASAQRGM